MDSINKPVFLLAVVRNIENIIKRTLNEQEENLVIKCVKSLPTTFYRKYSNENRIKIITNTVISELHLECHNNVDIHEIMKNNLDSQREDSHENRSGYLLLDSKYRILENDGTEYFKWSHINNFLTNQGTVNSIGEIRNIIAVKIMQYRLPVADNVDNVYKRVTLLIHEMSSQSFIAHEGRRFHFMGMHHGDNRHHRWVEIRSDDHCKGEYRFTKPITTLNDITISFGSPIEIIKFDPDRGVGQIVTVGNVTTINFQIPHKLETNDKVYITDFTTINKTGDIDIINKMNNSKGLSATVTTPEMIELPVNTSSLNMTLTGTINSPNTVLNGNIIVVNGDKLITGIGTTFMTDFAPNSYIKIINGANPIYQIKEIISDTQLLLSQPSTISGTFNYVRTSEKIIGNGTLFKNELKSGDRIFVVDGSNKSQLIKSVESNTELTLDLPYNGADGVNFQVTKNNILNTTYSIYFGSKRIFIMLELIYLE